MAERKSSNFFAHTARYAVGNVIRHVVGFAMLPIYTRFLSPADYGVLALLTLGLALVEPVFGARLSMALPKFYFESQEEKARRATIWTAVCLTGLVSALSMSLLVIFRGNGAVALFGDPKYAGAFGIFAVNLLTRPLEDTGMMYLRIHERSGMFLGVSVLKLALQLTLNVVLVVYLEEGVVGAILSGVISSVMIGGALTAYIAVHEAPTFDLKIIKKMLKFSWPLWMAGFGGLYVGSSGGMYLRVFDSLSDVGRLELALKFATAVSMLVWSPFSQQWVPLSYRIYRDGNSSAMFQVAFVSVAAAIFIGGLGVSIFAGPVIGLMAARPFYAAAGAVPLLTLGFIFNDLRSFFNFGFFVTDNTKIGGLCQYVMAAAITVAYFVLIPRYGLMGAAWGQCMAFCVGFIYTSALSRRFFDPGIRFRPMVIFIFISVTAYILSELVRRNHAIAFVLAARSVIYIVGVSIIVAVAVRAIAKVDASLLQRLPRPLAGLARLV